VKLPPPSISNLRVEDNFLEESDHKELLALLTSWEFPWFYQQTLTAGSDDLQAFGFNHWLSAEEHPAYANLVTQMESALDACKCLRVRADMTLYNPNGYQHAYHVDSEEDHMVCIYYVNDSDGDTLIRQDEFHEVWHVPPRANRLLIFHGKYYHTGHSPVKHKSRILINANFTV